MPEVTLSQVEERYLQGMECDLEVTVTNTGTVPLQNLDLRVQVYRDKFEDTVSSRRIRALPLAETQKFQLPYQCDRLVGLRRFRAYLNGEPVVLLER
jgi:uncharacterized membrane protein